MHRSAFLGLLIATLILGIPAVAALCWTAALLW